MIQIDILEFITLTANILTLSACIGLIFGVVIQPRRERANWYFAGFLLVLAGWALTSLLMGVPGFSFLPEARRGFYLYITWLGLVPPTFFLAITAFCDIRERLVRIMVGLSFVLVPLAFILLWTDRLLVIHLDALPRGATLNELLAHFDVLPLGYLLLGALSIYLVVGFLYLRVTPGERSSALRLPALLLTVGFAGNFIEALARLPFDTVLITVAAVWIGYTIISHQLFNPLAVMNDQLTDANKSLRNIIFELAAEKERVETLNAELIKTSQFKSEFLAKMSHELRTPLNSIVGYSELLLQGIYGDLAEKQVDRMEKIYRNGRDLLALINDILDLSKIEAGRLELDLHSMNLHDQLVEVAATFGPQIEQKGLEFTIDLPERAYPIFADPLRMRQILANLMSNALKFTAEGSISLKATNVTVKNGQGEQIALPVQGWISDGRWSVIQVADTGIGIAPQDQATIFDEFRQVDSASTREYGGSGLGLAITRKLVEMHGGRIWLRSTLDQGSTFFVALPASSLSVAESAPPPTPPAPEAEAPLVLVIDDSQEAIDILSTYLKAGGYRVTAALSGQEGLAQAVDLQPDVITVDIMMPDLSGWQVIDRLKADPMTLDIPVVVVSIVDEAPTNVRLDVAAHISKPVSQTSCSGPCARRSGPARMAARSSWWMTTRRTWN